MKTFEEICKEVEEKYGIDWISSECKNADEAIMAMKEEILHHEDAISLFEDTLDDASYLLGTCDTIHKKEK